MDGPDADRKTTARSGKFRYLPDETWHHSRARREQAVETDGIPGAGVAGVASALTIKPPGDPDLLTVGGDIADPATAGRIIDAAPRPVRVHRHAGQQRRRVVSKPFTDCTAADYALVAEVNLAGFFRLTQRAIAEMATRYGGHVVNITATVAEIADSRTPAALAALTKGGLAAATSTRRC